MSEKLRNLLSDIVFENEFSSKSLQTILKSCHEYQNFANKDAAFISQINSNLNANINIEQNHLLLNTVILQSSEELLLSHAVSWMLFCIRSSDSLSDRIQSVDYSNLYLLISKTHHSNDVKKQFVASILPKFILKLDTVPSSLNVCYEKLKCLEKVLKYYNGPCFSHYKSIERFLLQCLETWHSQDTILVHVGLCYTLLAQLGGGGHQTSLYRDNWQNALCKLVKYGHEVLDSVFEDVPEIQTVPIPASIRTLEVTIPFPSYYPNTQDTSKLHASEHLLRAFNVLSTLIRTHLAAPFPAPKTVNIEAVLSVVARTLSVTPPVLSNLDVTSGHAILLSMLPALHAQAHAVLDTLITVAGRNLIPHSLYICKLTVHTLKWTNTEEAARYSLDRPFRVLRCAVYQTLHSWLTLAGYSSNIELMADELIGYILADITYEKPPVTLTAVTKKTRKKHKTKVGLEAEKRPLVAGSGNSSELRETGDSVCALSHLVLGDLLKCAGLLLKPDLIKNIQTQISGLLLPLTTGVLVPPYSTCTSSRLALYSSLESLLLYSHPVVPDLSHYASVFYHAGLNDSHIEIRQLCQRGIELLEKIHHPKSDSLNFVLENLEEEKLKLIGSLTNTGEKNSILTNGMNGTVSHSEDESEEDRTNRQVDKKVNKNKGSVHQGKDSIDKEKATKLSSESNANKRKRKEKPEENIDEEDGRKSKKLKEASKKKDDGKKEKKQSKVKDNAERQLALIDSKKKKKQKRSILKLDESDDITSDESDDLDDSDDDSDLSDDSDDFGDESVAMMLMNAFGNNSDYEFEDDDSDDEVDDDDSDESDDDSDDDVGDCILDGFTVHTSMIGGDSDDSLIQMESHDDGSSSESNDSREGVVITEIVEEATTTVESGDKQEAEKESKENSKKTKSNTLKAIAASESEKIDGKIDKNSPKNIKKGTKNDNKSKDTSKKGVRNEEKGTKTGNESKSDSKGESEKMDIDLIELDNDESSLDETSGKDVEIVGVRHPDDDDDGDEKEEAIREEITISSDSQDEDVIAFNDKVNGIDKGEVKKGNNDEKVERPRVDENEEEVDDVAEEIDDCLKLFNAD